VRKGSRTDDQRRKGRLVAKSAAGDEDGGMPYAQMLFQFPGGFSCVPTVLGAQAKVNLNGRQVSLHLPREGNREVGFEGALEAPSVPNVEWLVRVNEHPDKAPVDWGRFFRGGPSESDWIANVSAGVLRMEIATATEAGALEAAQHVHSHVKDWYGGFRSWVEVLTEQDLGYEEPLEDVRGRTPLETAGWTYGTKRKPEYVYFNPRFEITMRNDTPLNLPMWRRTIAEANQGRQPPDSVLLLRDARAASHRHNPRKALIDCGTAVEVALSTAIRGRLSTVTVDEGAITRFLNKTNGMVQLFELASALGVSLPCSKNRLTTEIAEPRNTAVHQGAEPASDAARDALATATVLVQSLNPVR
jgi:hypothetical protein